MNELRKQLGFSLQELEAGLFTWMAHQFADVLVKVLEQIDDWLAEQRDRRRFRMRDMQPRTLQTLFGVDLTFRRRRYLDRQTGKMVYLLDEVLQLPAQKQLSPALTSWALGQAVLSNSYRGAARSLEALYGHRVVSHESIRQVVLTVGKGLMEEQAKQLEAPAGSRKVRVLFLEVDGLSVPLQREGRQRRVEEKLLTVHEGWAPRHPASGEYVLVNKRHFRTQARDFWELASRFVYSLYDVDENTVVVINGDRAEWVRQGVKYFPKAIYQVDTFHLMRELRDIFGHDSPVMRELVAAREADVTGAAFIARMAEAYAQLHDPKKRQRCRALLKDLKDMPEAVVDYRHRLRAQGIATEGFRGLGAAESQVDTFADRVKHRGRSWSRHGLGAIMEVLCWRNTERLKHVMQRIEAFLIRTKASLAEVKQEAVRLVERVVAEGVGVLRQAHVPITEAGRTRSGGLSRLMHRVISGATG